MTILGHLYQFHPATRYNVGDLVSCDWNCNGRVTVHRIVEKKVEQPGCQTGVLFRVSPPVGKGSTWVDAAWFFREGIEVL
jgi:hypothetical protein